MALTSRFKGAKFPLGATRIAGPLVLLAAFCVFHPSKALTSARFWLDNATGFAIGGFDPVGYYTGVTPRLGRDGYEYVWQGVAWRFASEGNLAAFKRDPEVYAPQYGGLDAVALSLHRQTPGNPRIFAVHNSKLYLFYSNRNKDAWLAMSDAERAQAEVAWKQHMR